MNLFSRFRQSHEPAPGPSSREQLWNAVVHDAHLAEGGFETPHAQENVMALAREIGHPRWAINATVQEAMGATERQAQGLLEDELVWFPENEELERVAAAKHSAIGVVREEQAPSIDEEPRRLEQEGTNVLRAEVREAYDEWMRDTTNWENEREYFHRLDKLDDQLASRGLERGDDLDEEVPLRTPERDDRGRGFGW